MHSTVMCYRVEKTQTSEYLFANLIKLRTKISL